MDDFCGSRFWVSIKCIYGSMKFDFRIFSISRYPKYSRRHIEYRSYLTFRATLIESHSVRVPRASTLFRQRYRDISYCSRLPEIPSVNNSAFLEAVITIVFISPLGFKSHVAHKSYSTRLYCMFSKYGAGLGSVRLSLAPLASRSVLSPQLTP